MIFCQELTKKFGEFTAVKNVSLNIQKGSICAFLGPNGAGKSTTVKMLTGQLRPTSGEVLIDGESFSAGALSLKRRIGVLPEDLGLFDDLTLEEHLLLTGRVYGLADGETRSRTEQLLRVLDLDAGRHTFARRSSHGMRKKTSFAMALLPNPEVLFLDEPFEAVDPVAAQSMQDLLRGAAQRGTTIFLTSHILSMIERVAHQVVVIQKGEIAWNSSIGELPGSLEELFFDLTQSRETEELIWLGS